MGVAYVMYLFCRGFNHNSLQNPAEILAAHHQALDWASSLCAPLLASKGKRKKTVRTLVAQLWPTQYLAVYCRCVTHAPAPKLQCVTCQDDAVKAVAVLATAVLAACTALLPLGTRLSLSLSPSLPPSLPLSPSLSLSLTLSFTFSRYISDARPLKRRLYPCTA